MKRLLAAFALLILLLPAVAFAADDEEPVTYACVQVLMEDGAKMVNDYAIFAEEYVQEDTPTSGQVDVLVSFYRYIRAGLNQLYEDNTQLSGTTTQAQAKDEANTCAYYRNQYLDYAEIVLQKTINGAVVSKRSFKTVDALSIIVQGLEDLSLSFAQIFPAALDDFNNALPCYASECL